MSTQGWNLSTVLECCDIVRGVTFPSTAKAFSPSLGAIACLRTANVQRDVEWEDLWFIPREFVRRGEQILKPFDILISLANSYELVGKVALVRDTPVEATLGAFISAIRCGGEMSPKFVFYQLTSAEQQSALRKLASTTTNISNISTAKLAALSLAVAPKKEQERLVAKIEELFSDLDAGVAALERARANLKRYRAAVLKAAVEGRLTEAWRKAHSRTEPAGKLLARILAERRKKWEAALLAKFAAQGKAPPQGWKDKYPEPAQPDTTHLPELPEGWCWATIDQTSEVQGGIQKQPKRAPKGNAYPYLRVANVYRNRLELAELEYFELFGDELNRLRLEYGDLLIVEGNGSKTEIGRSAIWRGEVENCVHQNHIIRARFLAGMPEYLNAYWNSPTGNGKVMDKAASTSGLYTLSVQKVSELPLPLPPLEEQKKIVEEVESRLSVIAHSELEAATACTRATRLRQSILKRAFEGRLVPQDPNDEPASALLARIRAARAKQVSAPKPVGRRGRPAKARA